MRYLEYHENGIYLVLGITEDQRTKLLHFSSVPFDEKRLCRPRSTWRSGEVERRDQLIDEAFQLVQVELSGYDRPYENHGRKYVGTAPGYLLKFAGISDSRNEHGRLLVVSQEDNGLSHVRTETSFQFYDGTNIVRCTNRITNIGTETQTLEYLASFSYTGLEKECDPPEESVKEMAIYLPFNSWMKELSWQDMTLEEAGFADTQPAMCRRTSRALEITNTGNWSAKRFLPMGYIENRSAHTSLYWQIEHNGSWHYEIGDMHEHFYLSVSGPTEKESHWSVDLKPGESFESVPVAVGAGRDEFAGAMGDLTTYRRLIRRPNRDDEKLPVIFNDYMNCLYGDPTTEKELPMIDAAAECGCEYYVIDAGWYAPGEWWSGVGEWRESRERFPEGIRQLSDYIRSKGMVPGLWLELEVMGIDCPVAKEVPDDWFFVRHGRRVFDRSRYQLDFRNPDVREYADGIIRRLVEEYGAGYIKMDYNIEPGFGTELYADSPGQGLLDHERAFLAWVDRIYEKYPDLVIENCSSGGLRMDYALLSRHSIQSVSDQEDFLHFATIAANAVTGVTPEQAAVWSYPLFDADEEAVIFNMVNAMLLRIHQSGHLIRLSGRRRELVEEGIRVYKTIRDEIRMGLPIWPLGLAGNTDKWLAAGLRCGDHAYLAVWKRWDGKDDMRISLGRSLGLSAGQKIKAECIYPACACQTDGQDLVLCFQGPYMARLFRVEWE